jgi:hypothetical protein
VEGADVVTEVAVVEVLIPVENVVIDEAYETEQNPTLQGSTAQHPRNDPILHT